MIHEATPRLFGRWVESPHLVGVGGMGLGPLGLYLAQHGFRVTGEDDALRPEMRALLVRAQVRVTDGGELPGGADLVVVSSAVPESHPTVVAARRAGVPVVKRGALLAEVARRRKLVAICGAHGKTTTTAMLIHALRTCQLPVGYVGGGLFADGSAPAEAGSIPWLVAEVDESDGTIAAFAPEVTVVVNLDWDHADHYGTLAELESAFVALFMRTRGVVLTSDACLVSRRAVAAARAAGATAAFETFGTTGDFSGVSECGLDRQVLTLGGRFEGARTVAVQAVGAFNAGNALAALAAMQLMGGAVMSDLLVSYPGVCRRQTRLHEGGGVLVLEDYAHHPTEIRVLLAALRARATGRVLVVFQPHRHSRTRQFKQDFARALGEADGVYLLDVYSAGEARVEGGEATDLAEAMRAERPDVPVSFAPGGDGATLASLRTALRPGDVVAFVGAGDIDRQARAWVAVLARATKAAEWDALKCVLVDNVSPGSVVRREEPLAEKTTIRLGGAARVYVEPASVEDLQTVVRVAETSQVPWLVLGRGSNLIVPDRGVDGLVISLRQPGWETFEVRPDGLVWVGAGLRLKNLCGKAVRAGLRGFEFLEGIPGNVGGALRMNAGAMGGWMFDVVEAVQVLHRDGRIELLPKVAMHVDYRHCAELHEAIALGALIRPVSAEASQAISQQIDAYREKRHKTQPREPSAGCIFKNPPNTSAGKLIDQSGLKGTRVGGAEVSPVHANFIVNMGGATADDVIGLVRLVRARVQAATGVVLEPEVLLYGSRWSDVLGPI